LTTEDDDESIEINDMGIKTLNENLLQNDIENNSRGNLDINYISDDEKAHSSKSKTQGFKRECYNSSNKDSIEEVAKSDGLIKNNFSTKQNKMCSSNDSQVVFDSHVYSLNIECGEFNKDGDEDAINIKDNDKNEFKGQVVESKSV